MQQDPTRFAASALAQAVAVFREFDPKMELGQLLVFLYVVAQPGIHMKELERLTGLQKSAMSRNVMALSSRSYLTTEDGEPRPGHNLVSALEDPFNRRAVIVSPTATGRRVMEKVAFILNRKAANTT